MQLDELSELAAEVREAQQHCEHCVRVCMAAGCQSSGAKAVLESLTEKAAAGRPRLCQRGGLHGALCRRPVGGSRVPRLSRRRVMYQNVTAADTQELVDSLGGPPVERLRCPTDVPFFTSQQKIVLENSGIIDPEQIKEYIAADGYRALVTALTEMTPAEVLREVDVSGSARARRRRLPGGTEMVDRVQDARQREIRGLQRG